MTAGKVVLIAAIGAAGLSACGGGSGGAGDPAPGAAGTVPTTPTATAPAAPATPTTPVTPTPATPAPTPTPGGTWLTLTPSPVQAQSYAGDYATVRIFAKSSQQIIKGYSVGVADSKGLVSNDDVALESSPDTAFVVHARTSAKLAPGSYATVLEVRICEDDAMVCSKPFPGSPWYVPLNLTVLPGTNLTRLNAISGLSSWSTYQGNAAHTGFVPASFVPAAFNRRWNIPANGRDVTRTPALDNGKAFLVRGFQQSAWSLAAIDEDTGQTAWQVDLSGNYFNSPAAANGKVYVTSGGGSDLPYLWIFDQASGALVAKTAMSTEGSYLAPTVYGGSVYAPGEITDSLDKFDGASGRLAWSSTGRSVFEPWTPAVDGTYAYNYSGGALRAVKVADGGSAFSVSSTTGGDSRREGRALVLDGQFAYVADRATLTAFDLGKRSIAWTSAIAAATRDYPGGQPVLANGKIYVTAGGAALEAHAAGTGALLWRTSLPQGFQDRFDTLVVTNGLAFVSSDETTLAVDLATHQVVWSHPVGGTLALSNRGVLYITNSDGQVVAVNLQ